MRLKLAFLAVLLPGSADAHHLVGHVAKPDSAWTLDPWIVLPLAAALLLYICGLIRLSRFEKLRGLRRWQMLCYLSGWLVLVLALISPLHAWGEQLLSLHMLEHELLMAVAAPLIAVGRPLGPLLWAFSKPMRRGIAAVTRSPIIAFAWARLRRPLVATVLHAFAIWVWHAPVLFDMALVSPFLHRLQHLSFFATGVLFWWALLTAPPRAYGVAGLHLFATMTHMGILGALLALAPRPLYRYADTQMLMFGLSRLQDQQLAGLLMWIPAGLIYAGAALVFCALWIVRSSSGSGERLHGAAH